MAFLKKERNQQLNRLVMSDGLRGILKEKDNYRLNMIFPSVPAFLARCIVLSERRMLMIVQTLYSDVSHEVYMGSGKLVLGRS